MDRGRGRRIPSLRVCRALISLLLIGWCSRLEAQPMGFPAIDTLLQGEVDQEHIAGAVVQIVREGVILHRRAYGFAQRYGFGMAPVDPPDPLTPEHLFDLASLTKVFATTFGVMLLVDRGMIDLDAPVRAYLPEFTGAGKDKITVRHLLTHTSGLSEWVPLYYHASSSEETYEYIAGLPLKYEVGEGRHYSDLGFMLLGYLIERESGRSLDAFLDENLYEPLGLRHTTFNPLENGIDPSLIAATSHGNPFERRMVYDDAFGYSVDEDPESWDGWRSYTLRGEVNDGNAYYANEGVAGHAGLFSTVDDLQILVDLLLSGGVLDADTLIRSDVMREFLRADTLGGNGLGWALDPEIIQTRGAPTGTFGHTGFTGTSVVVIPEHAMSIILLTNRQNVGPDDEGTYYNLNPTRQRLVESVLEQLVE